MLARYYSPAGTFRFASVDPGDDTDTGIPQSWNKYSYTRNNPLKFLDPDGEETQVAVGGPTERGKTGHIAIIQDGIAYSKNTVYSGEGGDWGVPAEQFLAPQDSLRETTILDLDMTPEMESILKDALAEGPGPEPAGFFEAIGKNSCVAAVEGPLRDAGVLPGPGPVVTDKAGNLMQAGAPTGGSPEGTADLLRDTGVVKSESTRGQAPANPAGTIETVINYMNRR